RVSETYQRVGLELVPAPTINLYTVVVRPEGKVIEIRAPWSYFRLVLEWTLGALGIQRSQLEYLDMRDNARVAALQHTLTAKLKRARHKHDTNHDYDTEEVTPNPHRNDGDLSRSPTYQADL